MYFKPLIIQGKFEVQITNDSGSIVTAMFDGHANKYFAINEKY